MAGWTLLIIVALAIGAAVGLILAAGNSRKRTAARLGDIPPQMPLKQAPRAPKETPTTSAN